MMDLHSDIRHKWIASVSTNEPHKFDRRLDWDNLLEDDFLRILQSPVPFFSPEFLVSNSLNIKLIQNCLHDNSELPLDSVLPNEHRSFVDLWTPLKHVVPKLLFDQYPHLYNVFTTDAISNLSDLLINRLVDLSDCLLWHQFLEFRRPGTFFLAQMAINKNQSPPRSSYQEFIFSLRRDSLSTLFSAFPVYEFFVGIIFSHWRSFVAEFIDRITLDRSSIESKFSIPASSLISSIQGDLSDPHRFGRSVLILTFIPSTPSSDFLQHRLVYKPKSLQLESKYYQFLSFLNDSSDLAPFYMLNILCKSEYGYVEYISRDNQTSIEDLPSFYRMLGRLSSVLLLLGCTDLHHENLILSSNQLILVDAETIFDSSIDFDSASNASVRPTKLEQLVYRSLLTCGLLPFWTHYGPHNTPIDLSALGIESPTSSYKMQDGWLYINSDAMSAGSIEVLSKSPSTLPYETGIKNSFQKYTTDFLSGFETQSEIFASLRHLLLKSDGPIDMFRHVIRRALIRSTHIYYTVQRKQFSPLALSSFTEQFLVLEKLSRGFLIHDKKPLHWPIFNSEKHQMINLDIPMFEHQIGSTEFITSLHANATLSFPDAHASVRQRLSDLDSTSTAFQMILIKGSFESSSLHISEYLHSSLLIDSNSCFSDDILSATYDYSHIFRLTLEQIISNVYYDTNYRCQWLGYNLHVSNVYSFFALNCSLFSGIASFPSYLDTIINSNDHSKYLSHSQFYLLEKIRTSTQSTLSYWIDDPDHSTTLRWWRDSPHGLNGCGGHLLSLSLSSSSSDIDPLFIPEVFDLCTNKLRVSLLNGSVGLIPALTTIGSSLSLHLAERLGKRICDELINTNAFSLQDQNFPIGFFHGTSGLASVFSRLSLIFPSTVYLDIARLALEYERHFFDCSFLIPPVLHTSFFSESTFTLQDKRFSFDLASGLSGVLLSRLFLFGTPLWDHQCLAEVHHFLRFILDYRHLISGINLSHGRLGPLAVVELALKLPIELPSELLSSLRKFVLEQRHIISDELLKSTPEFYPGRCLSLHPLGFYNGLVGISYYFKSIEHSDSNFNSFFTMGLFDLSD